MDDHYLLKKWSTHIPVILAATGVMLLQKSKQGIWTVIIVRESFENRSNDNNIKILVFFLNVALISL